LVFSDRRRRECAASIDGRIISRGVRAFAMGISQLPHGTLVSDVDFEGVRANAPYVTPVPGGVEPMTVTMLIQNKIEASDRAASGRLRRSRQQVAVSA
jgi:methylenetetrahydrofolate dehydrogenase (NADP+)/methenyltetrahydrofolate cyclohydrolase